MGTAGNKVTICSKLAIPIVARLQEWRTQVREHQGQQWQERVSVFVGEAVRINGTNVPPGMAGVSGWPRIENGTALTMGVDEHFWDQFVAQNPELPAIKGGFVWKAKNNDYAEGTAKDSDAKKLSGYEPFAPMEYDEQGKVIRPQDPRAAQKTPSGLQGPPTT